jgi:hypothetical protein
MQFHKFSEENSEARAKILKILSVERMLETVKNYQGARSDWDEVKARKLFFKTNFHVPIQIMI